tara:strand:- start:2121 stop:2417 length:297 start_codon:yes stop_codon:yes gene_type:complete
MNDLTIQDILDKANKQTKKFIKELDGEENIERVETIDTIQNDIKGLRQNVELKKKLYITELKSGLGEIVKKNPNKVTVIKKTFGQKVKLFLHKIFTKF